MTSRHALPAALLAALASFLPLAAAGPGAGPQLPPPPAGHSYHGEVFDEGPRQRAYLMGGTGNAHLAVTTRAPQAQAFFDQGLGQLHGFWYFEAERSFRQAAAIDPDCAMAYWGMAMANWENAKRGRGFIERAAARKKNASRREQLWIDGLADYLRAASKDKAKKQQYLRSLETIIQEYPEDGVEARAFLAVRLWQFKGELPLPSLQAVDALLDQVFAANPMHPAHHYRIHLWDDSKPARALGSAARGGPSAPTIAHMWHMPGHTYAHLQRYADAAWQQEASARADHAHMIRDRVLPDQIHNYAHNQEWLVRDLNFIGRSRDAVALSKNLIELPRHPRWNLPTQANRSASYGRARLLETLERFELWDEAVALAHSPYLEATDVPAEQVKRLRLLGLAHAGKGDRAALQKEIAELEKLAAPAPERPALKDKLVPPSQSKKRPPAEGKRRRAREASAETALNELKGCEAQLAGKPQAALELFRKVPGLSKERLARAHLLAGDKTKAEELARQAASAPNQVVPLAVYVEVLHTCGKAREAGEAFERLRKMSGHIDNLEAPIFKRLAPVAKALGLPADWRRPAPVAADVGERPPLDSIGPFLWHPPAAPPFALREGDGKPAALADYRGRPVLVLFYLGHGCLHCVEQLNRFGPKARELADLGISLVAISPEAPEDLKKSRATYRGQGTFPFRLLSDPKLEVFKTYRAYDDFEGVPLHGTFLIDGQGLLRWHDISAEPFNDVDFVLREAKRLLALPAPPAALRGPASARR